MKEIRWGIVGVGNVTEVKSGPALAKADGSALVAVMRRDGEAARDYARRHGVARSYDDADELLHDPGVDAIYVATPPDSHADYAVRAAAAGKPVYVEKPMARTAAECDAMIAACARAGVPLFVAHYRRAMPRFALVHRLIDDGTIGEVRTVDAVLLRADAGPPDPLPWRVVPEIAGGGYFVDLAAHALDLFDHWWGPIVDVAGSAANRAGSYPAEDTVTMQWEHASGVQGTGTWCFCAGRTEDRITVEGTRGRIVTSCFGQEPLRVSSGGVEQVIAAPYPEHVQQPLIQTIVDELLARPGAAGCPSTGETARRTVAVMDTVLAAYRQR